MSYLSFEGRRVLVTGATGGIGRSVAIQSAVEGARLFLTARGGDELERTLAALPGSGHVAQPYDLNDLEGIPGLVEAAAEAMGGVDALVHCAGVHSVRPLKAARSHDINRLLSENVTTAMMLAKGFRSRRVPKRAASLVLLSSVAGLTGQSGISAYSASKGAVASITRSLALELLRDGIRVNCVCPGVVTTQMTRQMREAIGEKAFRAIEQAHPLGIGTPDDVAAAILFLASDASRWVTGSSLVVDGGYTAI